MTAPSARREWTDAERALVRALAGCSFSIGSAPKRFARELAGAEAVGQGITEPQSAYLRRLVATYRRQIPASSIPESERYLLTDGAARAAREGERAVRWTAAPGRPVPSWVVRLTGKASIEAIVAKWGEGVTFERPSAAPLRRRRAPQVSEPVRPPPPVPTDQLDLLPREGR